MNITIIGPGFVGLTSAVVYASFGNQVKAIDIDQRKIDLLNQGVVSFYEPKLADMVSESLKAGTLSFTTSYKDGISDADVIMICVGTPSDENGQVDLKFVKICLETLAPFLKESAIVVIKSTVPPGTLDKAEEILKPLATVPYYLASMPEFLKEGTAVDDTLYPDRILIGATEEEVFLKLEELHAPLKSPMLRMSPASAQLAKYAANNYLAMRITFINQMADICELNEANIEELIDAIGYEKRIGRHYWYPGLGYGGSCFPKDVKGLANYAVDLGIPNNLFQKIDQLNSDRPEKLLSNYGAKMKDGWQGKKVAVLGLAFKPNTDDQRVSPALQTVPFLLKNNCEVAAYDPMVNEIADKNIAQNPNYTQYSTIESAVENADVILALIEWPQIVGFDFSQTKKEEGRKYYFLDIRNQFEAEKIEAANYEYFRVGS